MIGSSGEKGPRRHLINYGSYVNEEEWSRVVEGLRAPGPWECTDKPPLYTLLCSASIFYICTLIQLENCLLYKKSRDNIDKKVYKNI